MSKYPLKAKEENKDLEKKPRWNIIYQNQSRFNEKEQLFLDELVF